MKVYAVNHIYDEDGGYGDAVTCCDTVFITSNEKLAYDYVNKWNHPIIYDTPYAALGAYRFEVEEIDILDTVDINTSPTKFDSRAIFPNIYHVPKLDKELKGILKDENDDVNWDVLVEIEKREAEIFEEE